MAELGLIAIALDQRNHGRRLVDKRCNEGMWRPHHPVDMYGIMLGTARDISLMIDLLPARLGIATDRVGVTGGSLGGHVSLLAMALDKRIAVGAPQIGSGDYRRLMELRCIEHGDPGSCVDEYYPAELDAVVRRFDPIHHAASFADRPLHMFNGADDAVVQLECNERFYAAAAPHYTDPDRIKLTAVPNVGHTVTDEMRHEGNAWLARWL